MESYQNTKSCFRGCDLAFGGPRSGTHVFEFSSAETQFLRRAYGTINESVNIWARYIYLCPEVCNGNRTFPVHTILDQNYELYKFDVDLKSPLGTSTSVSTSAVEIYIDTEPKG